MLFRSLRANLQAQQQQILVETVAATLYGGESEAFAQLRAQAVDQLTKNWFDNLKQHLGPLAAKVGGQLLTNVRKNVLGFSEVSAAKLDGQVAEYILGELASGNKDFISALSQAYANHQIKGQSLAEVDAQISESVWEKIKNFFSRKKDA